MNFNKGQESGFTLIELIVAMAIGTVVGLVVALVSVGGLRTLRVTKGQERLHSNALFITDTIGYWMRQAEDFTVISSPPQLTVELVDGSTKVFSLSGDNEFLYDDPADADPATVLTTSDVEVSSLNFTELERSVRVEMTLAQSAGSESLDINTTLARRN